MYVSIIISSLFDVSVHK